MSEPCREAEMAEWKMEAIRDFGVFFYDNHHRFPSTEECDDFWEEYMDGDIRIGED